MTQGRNYTACQNGIVQMQGFFFFSSRMALAVFAMLIKKPEIATERAQKP